MILQYSTCMRWHETCHAISHESMRFTKWPQHKRHTKWPKVDENSLRTTASTEHCKQPITANHCVWHLPSLWKPPTSRKPQWSGPNMSGHVRICNHDYNDYRLITEFLSNMSICPRVSCNSLSHRVLTRMNSCISSGMSGSKPAMMQR